MRLQFFGAARTVTGSKHMITTENGTKILLDCGLFQGIQTDEMNQEFGFNPAEVDCVILSHAHIDHSGLLPRLTAQGFKGPIYSTAATADLCGIMLLDSAHIQQIDLERINERRHHQGRKELEMLYNVGDAEKCLGQFQSVNYGETLKIADGTEFFFTDPGHLLGSTAVNLAIKDSGITKKLAFTGDIGRPNDNILRSPEIFPQADIIICEATYGNRVHEKEIDTSQRLLEIVTKTCIQKKGKLIIPAFAVDRTQELIYVLDRLSSQGKLPRIPVYIDSPLAVKATKIMKTHDECFNPEILEYIERDGDAFAFPYLHYVSNVEESKAINNKPGPCIIISASGMAEAGRIKHHLKNNIENPNNTVLIVGYCGEETLGRAIMDGMKEVTIFGEKYRVNADVEVMDSFSAHADYLEMIQYLQCQEASKVKNLFLVHGEYEPQLVFKSKLEEVGYRNIQIPNRMESAVV